MLENLNQSVGIVTPMILLMALGWLLRRVGFMTEDFIRMGTRFSFLVAFPCSVFSNFVGLELAAIFNGRLLAYMLLGITLSMLLPLLVAPRLIRDRPTAAAVTQAAFRANFLIQGIPLLESIYGVGHIAEGAFLLPFVILLNNVLATVIFVVLVPERRAQKASPVLDALKKMAANPLILGSLSGMLFAALGWRLPVPVESTISQLGRMGTPLALICMGAQLRFDNLRRDLRITLPTVLTRLVVLPALVTLGGVALGFRGIALGTIFLFNGTCCAASGYVMASSLGGNDDIAAQCVCLSSVLSAFTMTAGIFVLLQLGLI